ncbi:MAG: long-chain fatty acid--CoA ligase [Gammaproteobacteria bacterium]|nr:long-chain fatty acid--CoA ligase [Gammaproteobacteria bacterium]
MKKLAALSEQACSATISDGEQSWDFGAVEDMTNQWRSILDECGAKVVAYQLPNGLDWVALNLALLDSDRVAVPIPDFFTASQVENILTDCGADTFVGEPSLSNINATVLFKEYSLTKLSTSSSLQLPPHTGLITYTSGSTGTPKGICLSWETLLETAQTLNSELAGNELKRHLSVLPLSLLLENTAGLYANLLNGSQLIVPPSKDVGLTGSSELDVVQLLTALTKYQPHSIILVPALLLALVTAGENGLSIPSCLKFVAVGGARVPESLTLRAQKLGIPVYEGYGLTECGSVISLNLPGKSKVGTAGRLLPHVDAFIKNGQLIVRHPKLLGTTQSAPSSNNTSDNTPDHTFATGDMVEQDDQGFLRINGRKGSVFITAYGRNLSPEWIESELTAQLEISHAAVFGEASTQNVALLLPRGEPSHAQISACVDRVNASLPDYAQIGAWRTMCSHKLNNANGITGNGRTRRAVIEKIFDADIQQMFYQTHSMADSQPNKTFITGNIL